MEKLCECGSVAVKKSMCTKCYMRDYNKKNKEKIKEYYIKNKEKINEQRKEYIIKNKEKIKEKRKEYRIKNKDNIKKKSEKYYDNNKEKRKEYLIKNKHKIKERQKEYLIKNKHKIKEYQKEYKEKNKEKRKEYRIKNKEKINEQRKERIKTDLNFKFRSYIRTRLINAIKRQYGLKAQSSMELLGCSIEDARKHLESKFDLFMTWENHGSYWHIDHIIPCASFDLTDPEQQKKCFHYTNLQPLEAIENIKKSDKILRKYIK